MWERTFEGFVLKSDKFAIEVSTQPVKFDVDLSQVHGARVVVYDGDGKYTADGIITDKKGITIGVKTADCYPIFLISENVVGVLHAGWRGSFKGIVMEGVRILYEDFKVVPSGITAIFGPGICGKCYEVGEDVAKLFGRSAYKDTVSGKYHLDLYEYNSIILKELGVGDIVGPPSCTYEDRRLYSHRRGDKKRLYNGIRMI